MYKCKWLLQGRWTNVWELDSHWQRWPEIMSKRIPPSSWKSVWSSVRELNARLADCRSAERSWRIFTRVEFMRPTLWILPNCWFPFHRIAIVWRHQNSWRKIIVIWPTSTLALKTLGFGPSYEAAAHSRSEYAIHCRLWLLVAEISQKIACFPCFRLFREPLNRFSRFWRQHTSN